MGAWGEEPAENDEAQEWFANSIEQPIIEAVEYALEQFVRDTADDVKKAQAEAAAALLIDLTTNSSGLKYIRFDIGRLASEQGLWDRAIEAIKTLLSEQSWLGQWSRPQKKADVLNELILDLGAAKNRR
jgi:hypothetical protein